MFKKLPYKSETGEWVIELEDSPTELESELNVFFEDYYIDDIIFHPDKKPTLKQKKDRFCRFCNKGMPDVTFRKDAHTIPQLTGNRNMISDFECDTCNSLFSKYESQLAYFLGVSRSLSFLKGQEGLPKYKSPDKKLIIEEDKTDNKIKIISDGLENIHWEIDEKNRKIKIFSVKHPYIPIDVFKSLIKMGLCYIDEIDIDNFKSAFKILQTDEHNNKITGNPIFRLYMHLFAGPPIPIPIIYKMRRKEDAVHEYCPAYCFVIYFGNYIFQFFMPYFTPDAEITKKHGKVHLPTCPPLLGKPRSEYFGIPQRGVFDLSGRDKVVRENQVITMSFDSLKYL
jgi:hypothetical protein